jgi:membrane-bound serine protease (ClpP class)
LLESPVPVAVFVSPRGARAGSAGTFITAAGHFAAMAPGTNIGAATPISGTGEDLGETLANKVTNDAAALIRSIAQERGRNQDKLEETVREAASFSAKQAVEFDVVDFIADDLDDLLA